MADAFQMIPVDYQAIAKQTVRDVINSGDNDEPLVFEVYIVWFSKVLKNWKALVATDMPDRMYYEVTHNGELNVTYVDVYKKLDNVVIDNNLEVSQDVES